MHPPISIICNLPTAAEAATRVGLQQDVLNEGLAFGLSHCHLLLQFLLEAVTNAKPLGFWAFAYPLKS